MKMLDPKNVITKTNKMMRNHIELFSAYLGDYEMDGSSYCFGDDQDRTSISYMTSSKLLIKVFSTRVRIVICNLDMPESWEAKTQLLGMIKAEGIVLREPRKVATSTVKAMNKDSRFMNFLFDAMQNTDLQTIQLKYNKGNGELTIDILPYAGAFVWVKLPPIYYNIGLKPHEVKSITSLIDGLKKYFSFYASSSEKMS